MSKKTNAVPIAVLRLLARWVVESARIVKKENRTP
jgi:hypothetical protein